MSAVAAVDWRETKNLEYKSRITQLSGPDLYGLIPRLEDPKIPFENHFAKSIVLSPNGRVRQIKCNEIKYTVVTSLATKRRIDSDLKIYENFLTISEKIGFHPNFLYVAAIVIKEHSEGKATEKPYMFLSEVEEYSNEAEIPIEEKIELFEEVKEALLHLHDCKIAPCAGAERTLVISSNLHPLFNNYAFWDLSPQNDHLFNSLYDIAFGCLHRFGAGLQLRIITPVHPRTREDLEEAIDTLIQSLKHSALSKSVFSYKLFQDAALAAQEFADKNPEFSS